MDIPDDRPLNIMEVCGGHTHSIFRYGVEGMLPERDRAGARARMPGLRAADGPRRRLRRHRRAEAEVIFTTFGDAMRVPGSRKSLLQAKADGADVRMVYSPMDALALARANPTREVVFFGLGFETTMPSTALTILQAENEGVTNFSVFCNHITIVPTIKAILDSPDLRLDGFLGPGHVSMVIGTAPYEFIARYYRKPMVVAGFEPLDILQSIWMVLQQIKEGRVEIENQYARVVPNAAMRRRCERSRGSTNCASSSSGGASDRSIIPASGCARNTRASTPSENSPSPMSRSPTPNPANAARC